MKISLFLSIIILNVPAFSIAPSLSASCNAAVGVVMEMSDISDEFPSDSSTEEIVDVDQKRLSLPSMRELSLVGDTIPDKGKPVTSISKEARAQINEALLKLEALNPIENPTLSPLLNGVWSLRYSGGYDEDWVVPSPTRQNTLFLYSGGY